MSGWQNASSAKFQGVKCLFVKMSKCQNFGVVQMGCLQNVGCQNIGEPLQERLRSVPHLLLYNVDRMSEDMLLSGSPERVIVGGSEHSGVRIKYTRQWTFIVVITYNIC